jgi:hypothetical protein
MHRDVSAENTIAVKRPDGKSGGKLSDLRNTRSIVRIKVVAQTQKQYGPEIDVRLVANAHIDSGNSFFHAFRNPFRKGI